MYLPICTYFTISLCGWAIDTWVRYCGSHILKTLLKGTWSFEQLAVAFSRKTLPSNLAWTYCLISSNPLGIYGMWSWQWRWFSSFLMQEPTVPKLNKTIVQVCFLHQQRKRGKNPSPIWKFRAHYLHGWWMGEEKGWWNVLWWIKS